MSGPISNSDGTQINAGSGGDIILDEAISVPTASSDQTVAATGTTTMKAPWSKIHLGRPNQDDGPVSAASPMPVTSDEIEGKLDRIIELLEKQTHVLSALFEILP